jgi:RimJ/RimL family protein N-acetyltransferase
MVTLSEIDVKEILGIVACENISSAKVLEKSGFKFEIESLVCYLGEMRMCRRYSIGTWQLSSPVR